MTLCQLSGVSFISRLLGRRSVLRLKEGKRGEFFWLCSFLWKETQEAKYACLNITKPDALDRLSVLGRAREWRLHKCCSFHRKGGLICVLSGWSLHRCVSCVHRWRSNTPLPYSNVPVNNSSLRQQLQRLPKRREVIVLLRGETPKPNIHVVLWATAAIVWILEL
jgi:hypothetical protein